MQAWLDGSIPRATRFDRRACATEGTSLNQFVASAVAEKVAALRTASYFAERRGRADWPAFDRLMARGEGEAPRAGDEPDEPDEPT